MVTRFIAGIDPGLSHIGLALINSEGKWLSRVTIHAEYEDFDDRIMQFSTELQQVLIRWRPNYVAIEHYSIYGLKASVTSAFKMGRVSQVIISAALDCGATLHTYSSRNARAWLCGNGSAKDSQVKEALRLKGYTERCNVHERDALLMALYCLEVMGVNGGGRP